LIIVEAARSIQTPNPQRFAGVFAPFLRFTQAQVFPVEVPMAKVKKGASGLPAWIRRSGGLSRQSEVEAFRAKV
jgi:hypothetical protein